MNVGKARERLGWTPRMAFPDGLKKLVGWVTEHKDLLKEVTE